MKLREKKKDQIFYVKKNRYGIYKSNLIQQ